MTKIFQQIEGDADADRDGDRDRDRGEGETNYTCVKYTIMQYRNALPFDFSNRDRHMSFMICQCFPPYFSRTSKYSEMSRQILKAYGSIQCFKKRFNETSEGFVFPKYPESSGHIETHSLLPRLASRTVEYR